MIRLLIHYHQSYLRICIVENYTAFKKRWYHETDTLLFVSNRERQNVVKNKRSRLDIQQNPYNTSSRRFRVSRWTYIELLCWNFYDKWDCGRYIRHSDMYSQFWCPLQSLHTLKKFIFLSINQNFFNFLSFQTERESEIFQKILKLKKKKDET